MLNARRQPARAGSCAAQPAHPHRLHHERHRPEQTVRYRLVQQHAAHFIAHTAASTGAELPRFIKAEPGHKQSGGLFVPGEVPGRWPGAACKASSTPSSNAASWPADSFLRLRCGECGHDKLQVELKFKTPWRDDTTHLMMSPLEFIQRLAALVPRPRLHLIRFHAVLAPNA